MSEKKVLIITYYWPPSGGSGVQRWLKFVKYLVPMGWETFVYTPENPSFTITDSSLQKDVPIETEVIKLPIWEPYQLFFSINKFFGKDVKQMDLISTGKKSFLQKVSAWVRGNVLIPDPRIFWIKPSVKILSDLIESNQIDKIITTGPPHSFHLIGLRLKKKNPNLKWIADFRDPWSEWDLLDTLSLTSWARARHRKLEREVLTKADHVITIAPYHVQRLEELSGRKVELITNGFDEDDFPKVSKQRTDKFIIRHIGVVDELRDPRPFLNIVKEIGQEQPELLKSLAIEFVGQVNSTLKNEVMADPVLSTVTKFVGQIPHSDLLKLYVTTDLQLLVLAHSAIAPGNLPGKFFEYLASGNPIFGIGPEEGDAAEVLNKAQAGVMIDRANTKKIKSALLEYHSNWKAGKSSVMGDVMQFSRKRLTEKLVEVLSRA